MADADQARIKHQIVPVEIKIAPKNKKAAIFEVAAESTNCGRNAR
jgi:hypothetical protein